MTRETWQRLADAQGGMLTRGQLRALGIDRWAIRHRVDSGRWIELTPTVIGTTTGPLHRDQLMWLGVLHGGDGAMLGELTAAELAGLRNWHRDDITVLVPDHAKVGDGYDGIHFKRTRRPASLILHPSGTLPRCRIEPAVLLFAAGQRSMRTAEGSLAAAVQQRLVAPSALINWIELLRPLRHAPRFRRTLLEIDGGAHSVAELDLGRLCRRFGLARPHRQVRRRDSEGKVRYTDCEWKLADGRTLVLEIDGAFHMDVAQWEDDLARQRALTDPTRVIVHCTARELRDEPDRIARDLRLLGVPAA